MDSRIQLTEDSQENAAPEEQTHQLAVAPVAVPPFATASFSHFTAVQHATHSFPQHRSSSSFASPARISCGSTISANPLQSPLTLRPRRALDPLRAPPPFVPAMLSLPTFPEGGISYAFNLSAALSLCIKTPKISFDCNVSGNVVPGPHGPIDRSTPGPDPSPDPPTRAAGPSRRASIVWFRQDLRVHDNESLNAAHDESMSVLHLYCFDPRRCREVSSTFLVSIFQSVSDLRRRLRDRGSDLVVRVGHPEKVLPEMARAVGAEAVYAHRDVFPWSDEWSREMESEEWVEAAMKEEGMEVKHFWGNSLFHIDDLPFKLEDMPRSFGDFEKRVQGVEVRKPIAVLDQLKGLPKRGHVEPGEIPSLKDLGVTPTASMAQDVEAPPEVGSERGALQWLKKFAAQYQAQQNEGFHIDKSDVGKSIDEIVAFMRRGCLSPRVLFEELKGVISAASKNDDGGSSSIVSNRFMDWLVEFDFERFFLYTLFGLPVIGEALAA